MNVAVLASGAGTNLQALLDRVHGREGIEIVAVASDKPDAPALERARAAGVQTAVVPCATGSADRVERDRAMADWLAERAVELVVLAGYMQLLCVRVPGALPRPGDQRAPGAAARVPGAAARSSRRSPTGSRCSASPSTSSTGASTPGR